MRLAICVLVVVVFCNVTLAKSPERPEKVEGVVADVAGRASLDCSSAIPIRIGDFVSSTNVGAPSNVTTYSCIAWDESAGEVVFELTIDEAGSHDVGISIGYDENVCDLDYWILNSCDEGDCIEYDDYANFFTLTGPATYYIVVDGYHGDECPFTLTVVDQDPPDDCCPLLSICASYNFGVSMQGATFVNCGGAAVWDWGSTPDDPALGCDAQPLSNSLGTSHGGVTPDYAGEIAMLGPMNIEADCSCMELCHYYNIEEFYDGGNVKISTDGGSTWELVIPTSYYDGRDEFHSLDTACIRGELAYSSEDAPFEFRNDCFDLSKYIGESVHIGLFFGSDSGWGAAGWYIDKIRIGQSNTPVEHQSWGAIKALYR